MADGAKRLPAIWSRNGPVSPQDRWEEDPGYTPFTVAAEIAALLAAADMADLNHEASIANLPARDRRCVEHLHRTLDVYVRHGLVPEIQGRRLLRPDRPEGDGDGGSSFQKNVNVKNVTASEDTRSASHLVSPDALALVRFGLRAADDPRIRDTAKVIDALLKVETPTGCHLASLQRRWLWRA